MKYSRTFALLFIVSMLISASIVSAGGGEELQNHREIIREMPAGAEVRIELVSADCFIETGPGETVTIRIDHSYPEDRYQVDIREQGGVLALRERFLQRTVRGSATWYVTVPGKTELLFSSASGNFDSRGDYEKLDARSAAGNIDVRELHGQIEINTAAGSVGLREVSGDLSVTAAAGDIEIEQFTGLLYLRCAAGDVRLSNAEAEIEATTVAGRTRVSELRLSGECSFSSTSGDIEVELADAPAFDLTLSSAHGSVELDFAGSEMVGTFVFSALQLAGKIESPFDFDTVETFVHAGQSYESRTVIRGSDLPRVTLTTATGKARLKP
jgi:DUF4097 and DUF4098 domain-containing protein YvlB